MDTPKPDAGAARLSWPDRAYRELLRFVWGEPATYKDGNVAQIERALCTIRGFAILGLIPVMVYGAIAGSCGAHCGPSGGALAVVRGLSVALLASIAAFSAGGMLGFLFGLPRWGDAPQGTLVVQPGSDASGKERKDERPGTPGAPEKPADKPAQAGAAGAGARPNRVRPNTGLEKVMDWLTTLIVGLGLVHAQPAMDQARSISGWVSSAIAGGDSLDANANFTGGAAILLPYLIAGFFIVYLWAQRYMGREMMLADIESNTIEQAKQEMKEENEETKRQVKKETGETLNEMAHMAGLLHPAAAPASGAPVLALGKEELLRSTDAPVPVLAGVDPATAAEIRRRYAQDEDWDYEPLEGFGPQEAGGRRIDATVSRSPASRRIFNVTLTVRSTSPAPLGQPVVFLLHHTLPDPVRRVMPVGGVATLTVPTVGAFVAGAVIAGENTRLALDLSKLPGVPQEFRDN